MKEQLPEPVKVLIIDDHRLFADGLELILQQLDLQLEISIQHDPNEALSSIDQLSAYDLLLVDLQMPQLSGFGLLEAIEIRKLPLKVIVISGTDDRSDISRAMAMGVHGFIPKNTLSKEILKGVTSVLNGERYLPDALMGQIDWQVPGQRRRSKFQSGIEAIRPRQVEVLRLMQQGNSNGQIAAILGISESTVKSHVSILFTALNAKNRLTCVQAGVENGII